MEKIQTIQRFSYRVKNYANYRPGYPYEIIPLLREKISLTHESIIADIGSGTGKSAEPFLYNKNKIYAVEPNDEMRWEAEREFGEQPNFISIPGTAEATELLSGSVDIIIAAQAFHWFNPVESRKEFTRILKRNGWVVLIWNERDNNQPFLKEYDNFLINNSVDYQEVNHRNVDESILNNFFGNDAYQTEKLSYYQAFNFNGLKGRYLSCSYAYTEVHPMFNNAMRNLKNVFGQYQKKGMVKMDYITTVYFGQLTS